MARGIPHAFHYRGRKNMRPPVQRDSNVYRDMRNEEAPEAPKPEPPKPEPPKPEPPKPEPVMIVEEPVVEPEPEPEPELTMKNSKAEMLSVARAMGLDVNEDMTKKQILAAIDNA
jgi:hypothetical protein